MKEIKYLKNEEFCVVNLSRKTTRIYYVSSLGRCVSEDSYGNLRFLRGSITHGVRMVSYTDAKDGTRHAFSVSREIARSFIGEPADVEKMMVIRINRKKRDEVSNLKWIPLTEAGDPKRLVHDFGLVRNSKLTKEQVVDIRKSKLKNTELGWFYGVSDMQISRIKRGENWKQI